MVCAASASRAVSGERRPVTGGRWGSEKGWEEGEKGERERWPQRVWASFPLSSYTDEEPISAVLLTPGPPLLSPPRVETSTVLGFGGECGHYDSLFGVCGASGRGIDSAILGGL